jgi:hypothetical protein
LKGLIEMEEKRGRGRPPKKENVLISESEDLKPVQEIEDFEDKKLEEVIEQPSFQESTKESNQKQEAFEYRFRRTFTRGKNGIRLSFTKGDLVHDLNQTEIEKFMVDGLIEKINI